MSESPWVDTRLANDAMEKAERLTGRRFLKTHLPIDALVYSPRAKYIYIGRDGKDVFLSWYNHLTGFKPEVFARIDALNPDEAPYDRPNPAIRRALSDWLDRDGYPNVPFWSHVQGWFDARSLPNLLLVHFADLKREPLGEIKRVAQFLEVEPLDNSWPAILEHCSFSFMRAQAIQRDQNSAFKEGGATFFNKGTNDQWKNVLNADDVARYETEVAQHLTPACARWLEGGRWREIEE